MMQFVILLLESRVITEIAEEHVRTRSDFLAVPNLVMQSKNRRAHTARGGDVGVARDSIDVDIE